MQVESHFYTMLAGLKIKKSAYNLFEINKSKLMHGQYAQVLDNEETKKKSIEWLCNTELKETTESLVIAAKIRRLLQIIIKMEY